ncbi:MAG TPA: hypothetical protein VN018_05285 [Brevundimonas sp.]|nr:hypothetical protein [Brevundimonas sp.]
MTARRSWASNPRHALMVLAGAWLAATLLFVVGGVADLHDGKTWNKRGRYEGGPRWYRIVQAENPKGFKAVVVFRYVLPITILGSATLVCFLGAMAQPKRLTP